MTAVDNVDLAEIDKFNELAHRWWDTDGDFKPLHDINPCRLGYIQDRADLAGGPMWMWGAVAASWRNPSPDWVTIPRASTWPRKR